METEIRIKNMVCPRCVAAVDNFLKSNNFNVLSVELGKAVIDKEINPVDKDIIAKGLKDLGFELMDGKKSRTVEQIKNCVIEFVHYQEGNLNQNLSDYIVSKLHSDYSSLSKMFSEQENITIEKYFIAQKTEKVKELLSYGELTLNEIAFKLNYSSPAYLSAQFKQVTGMTPSQYKASKSKDRKFLDSI